MQSINLSNLVSTLVRLSILCALILICVGARANGGGGEKAEGEAKAEESGKPENSDFAEYNKLNNKMSSLKVKVEEARKELEHLIAQKKMGMTSVKDEKGVNEDILDLIVKAHKEMTEEQDKFNSTYNDITYRFPSKGQEIKRQYHPFRPKTVGQVEKELGLGGQLSELRNKVVEKYKSFNPPETEVEPMPKSHDRMPASESEPKRLTLKK